MKLHNSQPRSGGHWSQQVQIQGVWLAKFCPCQGGALEDNVHSRTPATEDFREFPARHETSLGNDTFNRIRRFFLDDFIVLNGRRHSRLIRRGRFRLAPVFLKPIRLRQKPSVVLWGATEGEIDQTTTGLGLLVGLYNGSSIRVEVPVARFLRRIPRNFNRPSITGFAVTVPVALILMTETDFPPASNGTCFFTKLAFTAIWSPGLMLRTRSRNWSSYPFSQIPCARKRGS